ncbi:MAG TPA: peptidase S8 [Pseudonocardiaceae bacterium]|nr:peptidase S8 [Pseudonocardiaceae bacterium]
MLPTVGTAQASTSGTAATAGAAAQASQLHQEVTSGTLLQTHGVRPVCAQCESEVVTATKGSNKPMSTALPSGYGPSDLSSAYKITGSSTATSTIAIIDAGVDGNLAKDLATYRSTYGLPACTTANGCLKLENYTGGAQPAPQKSGSGASAEEDIAVETALDVDMASAACPSCHITELSVPWQDGETDSSTSTGDFAKAVATAVAGGAKTVSISYGYTANSTNTSGTQLSSFNHAGVAIEASTGDSGFNGGTHSSWPSDLPYVVGVGGTQLTKSGSSYTETAWGVDSNNGAAGSGCETYFKAANGQPAAVTKDCDNHLADASVSADASPVTGLAVYDTYAPSSHQPNNWIVVGGTSASSPYIAGLFARAGVPSTLLGPNTLYAAAASNFRDITSGNNELQDSCSNYPGVNKAVCNAGTGWDGPTGIGSPNGLGAF